jgi:hypothetical protein
MATVVYIQCACTFKCSYKGNQMSVAIERIVVQASPTDKAGFVAKAKELGVSLSELMRSAAKAYGTDSVLGFAGKGLDKELPQVERLLVESSERSIAAIEDALAFVERSNLRIAAMEKGINFKVSPAPASAQVAL